LQREKLNQERLLSLEEKYKKIEKDQLLLQKNLKVTTFEKQQHRDSKLKNVKKNLKLQESENVEASI